MISNLSKNANKYFQLSLFIVFLIFLYLILLDLPIKPELSEVINPAHWFKQIHVPSNAYYMWRYDKFIVSFGKLFGSFNLVFLDFINICIFCIGSAFLCLFLGSLDAGLLSIIFASISLIIWGFNSVLFGSFAYFPYLLLSLLLTRNKSILFGFLSLFFAWRITYSANWFSLFVVLLSIISTFCLEKKDVKTTKFSQVFFWLIILVVANVYFNIPETPFPDYPKLAQVVNDDGLPGHLNSLVNTGYYIPVIDKAYVKSFFLFPCIILTILTCLISFFYQTRLSFFLMSLNFIVLLDLYLPAKFSSIFPISSLERLVPGFNYFSLTISIIFISTYLLFLDLISKQKQIQAFLFCIVIFLCFGFIKIKRDFLIEPNFFLTKKDRKVILDHSKIEVDNKKIFLSPSLSVIKNFGSGVINNFKKNIKYYNVRNPNIKIRTSQGKAIALRDGSTDSRWHVKQNGNEWVKLIFKNKQKIAGVELLLGKYASDFPRGIEILKALECESKNKNELEDIENYESIYKSNPWKGLVVFTNTGYPYLGTQSDVKIFFDKPELMRCLLIKQIGKSEYFDWSIAELRVMREIKLVAITESQNL